MIALGLICLLLAVVVTIGMLLTGTSQDVLFQNRVGELTTSPLWIFVVGLLVGLLTPFGVSVLGKGTRQRTARHKELQRLRRVEQEHVQQNPVVDPEEGATSDDGQPADERPAAGPDAPPQVPAAAPRSSTTGPPTALGEHRAGGAAAGKDRASALDRPAPKRDR